MKRPLEGRVVLVTRPEPEARELARRLERLGASALVAPTIRIAAPRSPRRLDAAIRGAAEGGYGWVAFTSAAAVAAWFARALDAGFDARALRARVAAVGSGTASALRERGILPDLVPSSYTTAALARAFPRGSGAVALPRADIAPDDLPAGLTSKGWRVEEVEAYRTVPVRALPAEASAALRRGEVDAVLFTSASTVKAFVRAAPGAVGAPRVVCVGPVTARAARLAGLPVHAVARPHTTEGLVEATVRSLARRT